MRTWLGYRALLAICGAFIVLLAALAVVQYRWSTRVAAADAQREKEHLESAASLFANEFNGVAARAMQFLQNDAPAAMQSGAPITRVPKLITELYYFDNPAKGTRQVRRLDAQGLFVSATAPPWAANAHCTPSVTEGPSALVSPVYDTTTSENRATNGARVFKMFRWHTDRCFVARINEAYLRDTLFPQLIRQSFGETAAGEYDFAVVPVTKPGRALYGTPSRADVQKPFFSVSPLPFLPKGPAAIAGAAPIVVQRVETVLTEGTAGLHGSGIWELQVAHKGLPLAASFERRRQRDMLLSTGVETLLVLAIVFLVIAARRMQKLADQKMRFVAGVSHEFRTPVSAISMLSRNQADGLVTGAEKVKQYGELIHQQSRRLNEMVEQTLQYAGVHSGLRKRARDMIDLANLIQLSIDARREALAAGGFEVELAVSPGLPRVAGDANLLRTAFDNLLDNAQKYADSGHWIRVTAEYSAEEKQVRISVEDRGAGIDPTDQAEIFEPFSRGQAAVEAQIPGSGLGLSLVRSAAEAHRGSVSLVSEPGHGCTFTMHLPV